MQISLRCALGKLWDETLKLVRTHRIVVIQPTYNDPEDNDYKYPQIVTGYVIIAERYSEREINDNQS